MEIIFKCEHCDQELSVDEAGAGVQIECPSCHNAIVVPSAEGATVVVPPPPASQQAPKGEKQFKVPTYDKAPPPVATIEKPLVPLEAAARETDKKLRVKTIRHSDHIEVGKDLFDDHVSQILQKIGEPNIVSITPIVYTHMELSSRQFISDYGVMIVYRG